MRQDITYMHFLLRFFLIIVSHQVWQEGAGGGHGGWGEEEHRCLCRVIPQGGQDHAGVYQVHGEHGQADPLGTFLLKHAYQLFALL